MQLEHKATVQEGDKTFDVYVYSEDDGATVYHEDVDTLKDVCNSQAFMEAELRLQPAETLLIRDSTAHGRRQWRLISRTQSQLNRAPSVIPVGGAERQP